METGIIGKVVDTYKITGVLGKGGMGIVYKAKDTTLDRDVALKMMDAALARDESFLKRFQSEAKALAKLQNPNIVSIFALRETDLGFCIAMEFVEGNTLADRIREKGAMPFENVFPIFKQLLTALDHAHEVGIIHRDIKPSNVMLTKNNVVKVTDFGLAKIQQVSGATMTLGTGGTLYYMSPEQIRGLSNVDHRGDIYSLGMTLYETLTGKVPFTDAETDFSIRQTIVEGKVPPPDKMNPALPRDLVKVVMKSIEKDPEKRYQSAGAMLAALEQVYEKSKEKRAATVGGESVSRSSRKSRLPIILGGLLLVVIAIAVYLFSGSPAPEISVTTQPARAEVFLNGVSMGMTPFENKRVGAGIAAVRITQSGYVAKDTTLSLSNGQNLRLAFSLMKEIPAVPKSSEKLSQTPVDQHVSAETKQVETHLTRTRQVTNAEPVGTLVLKVVPDGDVTIDGGRAYSHVNRAQRIEVAAGEHTIQFQNPTLGSATRRVTVGKGKTEEVTCYFERYVSIGVSGDSNWGTILIDGKRATIEVNGENVLATAPQEKLPLTAGKHTVLVTREGFETIGGPREIDVRSGFDADIVSRLVFDLKKN